MSQVEDEGVRKHVGSAASRDSLLKVFFMQFIKLHEW